MASLFLVTFITFEGWPFPHVSLEQTQVLLSGAAIVLSWARMCVKPSKSRNLVFFKRKILNGNALSIKVNKNMDSIPPITEKPVRFLGRTISDSFLDRNEVENFLCV